MTTVQNLETALAERILVLDGAMGTECWRYFVSYARVNVVSNTGSLAITATHQQIPSASPQTRIAGRDTPL